MPSDATPPPGDGDTSPPPAPPPPAKLQDAPAAGAPPPAAKVVAKGRRKEGDSNLAAELEKERQRAKKAEIRVCELEDENHRLKNPTPPAAGKATEQKRSWLQKAGQFLDEL